MGSGVGGAKLTPFGYLISKCTETTFLAACCIFYDTLTPLQANYFFTYYHASICMAYTIYRGAQPARPFHSKQTLLKSIALFFFSKWRTDRTRRRDFCGRYTKPVSPQICPGAPALFISVHFEPFSIHSCTSSILSDLHI